MSLWELQDSAVLKRCSFTTKLSPRVMRPLVILELVILTMGTVLARLSAMDPHLELKNVVLRTQASAIANRELRAVRMRSLGRNLWSSTSLRMDPLATSRKVKLRRTTSWSVSLIA